MDDPPHQGGGRWKKVLLWTTGATGVGIVVLTIPFLLPAVRKYALPYLPASQTQISRITSVLAKTGTKAGQRVVDLGSGDGRVVISMAKQGYYSVGYDLNPLLVLYSRLSALYHGVYSTTEFHCKDLWKVNLSTYNNIIIFGVNEMMEDIGTKISREASPGTCVIACRFKVPQWTLSHGYQEGHDSVWVYHV